MMKKIAIAFTVLALGSSSFADNEVESLEIKNDNSFDQVAGWWCENAGIMGPRPGGVIAKAPDGRSGSCMKITNTEKSVVSLYSRTLIPVDPATDTFKMSFYVKGKGKYRIGFYTYAKDKKYINQHLEPATEVDSTEWVKKDYTIPASKLKETVEFARIAIELQPGTAELYFDDFSGVKETALQKK